MLHSPLYIDIKCTTAGSPGPVTGVWLSLAPAGAGDSLGHEGCEFGLRNERVSQCEVLHQLQAGKQMEQRLLREPGKVEAARAAEGNARSWDVFPQPRAGGRRGSVGDLLSLPHLVPTRKEWMLDEVPWAGVGTAWAAACVTVGLWKNAFFPPKGAALIEGEGCPAWCCLKGSSRCRARH